MQEMARLKIYALIFASLAGTALGHGYLTEPPGRSSAWRFGFDTPVDYNDDECDCGGYDYQYDVNGGLCGICGDAWDQDPRDHEVGGPYATGTIVRDYTQGQVVPISVNVTINHLGHFEYKICANNDVTVEATQDCLDLTPLYAVGEDDWHLYIGEALGIVSFDLQLPADLTCSQCVLQWRYVGAQRNGTCDNGTVAVGCGPQAEYDGCADVSISAAATGESPASSPEKVAQQEQAPTRTEAEAPSPPKINSNGNKMEKRRGPLPQYPTSQNSGQETETKLEHEHRAQEQNPSNKESLSNDGPFRNEFGVRKMRNPLNDEEPEVRKFSSLTESEAKQSSEENADKKSESYANLGGQQQRALKIIEEMAVTLRSKTEIRSDHEQEIFQELKTGTIKEDDDALADVAEEANDSDSDSESDEDDDALADVEEEENDSDSDGENEEDDE